MTSKRVSKTGAGSASVLTILAAVIAVEGGYVDHPSDPGGATKYGITERTARACGYRGDMKALTESFAYECYAKNYVERPGFLPVVEVSGALGKEVIDTGVNVGTSKPGRWFQESLNHLNRGGRDYADVTEDGQIGPATMYAYKRLQQVRGEAKACQLVVKLMDAKQAGHYMRLASNNSKFETFMPGWIDHRLWNVPMGDC